MPLPNHLVFFTDENPGFTRKKWGRGFRYYDVDQKPIESKKQVQRIKALVIPPAWGKVWICPKSAGHLQSTGYDLKNRKQYIYHPDWMAYRQQQKFDNLSDFGEFLPTIRKRYTEGLKMKTWHKEKVLALILYLLDNHYFRIGNKQYAERNETYGLTTLRRKHLDEIGQGLEIVYNGKSGKQRKVKLTNKRIIRMIKEVSELPGYEVFRYHNSEGRHVNVESKDVNKYLLEITGKTFTAKEFRTWGASVLALEKDQEARKLVKENNRLNYETTLVKLVAKQMGNTIAVCREYYIHPMVLDYLSGKKKTTLENDGATASTDLSPVEKVLLSLLT